jgi:hypothetical protein
MSNIPLTFSDMNYSVMSGGDVDNKITDNSKIIGGVIIAIAIICIICACSSLFMGGYADTMYQYTYGTYGGLSLSCCSSMFALVLIGLGAYFLLKDNHKGQSDN